MAIAYAQWLMRRYGWAAIAFGVLGVLDVVAGAVTSQWFNVVLGAGFIGVGAVYGLVRTRARRSVALNQASR